MHRRKVLTIEHNPPGHGPAQLQYCAAQSGLAAAGLADQTKRLAARNLQAYAGYRVHGLAAYRILNDEVLHLEKRIALGLPGFHYTRTPAVTWIG